MQEPEFKPKPGQVDYTNVRWAPVINCVVQHQGKILLVQRSAERRFYPEYWGTVDGFLDDHLDLEQKVKDELREEIGITEKDIVSIRLGQIFLQDAPQHRKTWIVHPVLVEVKTDRVTLDWEAQDYRWVSFEEVKNFKLLPGQEKVFERLLPVNHG